MTACPSWCTRTHVEGPGLAIVHEGDTVSVAAVPEPNGLTFPLITTAVAKVDDEPTYICVDGDLLTADNAEKLAYALLAQVAAMRAEHTLQVTS